MLGHAVDLVADRVGRELRDLGVGVGIRSLQAHAIAERGRRVDLEAARFEVELGLAIHRVDHGVDDAVLLLQPEDRGIDEGVVAGHGVFNAASACSPLVGLATPPFNTVPGFGLKEVP